MTKQIPIVNYLVLDDGPPHLMAYEAEDSGALVFERHNADPKSGVTQFRRRSLAATGTVRSFTIVHRAAPGILVPFISALVNLDGGGVVSTNLRGIDPDPEKITPGMPVKLTTYVAGTDDEGTEAITFAFEPA